jgi:shikimate 5-dehydrogenase
MFDGKGMLRGLRDAGGDPKGRHVMLLGAGGAGSAIADAVAEAGAASLTIFDLDKAKVTDLAARLNKYHPGCKSEAGDATAEGKDIIINATPMGMADGDPLPLTFGKIDSKVVVADVIVKPGPTPFLQQAQASGCRVVGGSAMINGQAAELMRFFGIEP